MRLAFLFPGQGAQAPGMGRALAAAHPAAREAFATADRVLGYPLSELCWQGPAEELKKSVHAQPALLVHAVAAWRLVEAAGLTPAFVAGHSLGEYSACVAAGALGYEDALRLTHRRGELMYEAGLARPGAMAAILGLPAAEVEAACAEAADAGVVCAANLNAPGQVVISGEPAAVERAGERAKARGAKRAIRLEVSGAFHSPLMAPAAEGLAAALDATAFHDPRCPVVANAWARPVRRADEVRSALRAQLLAPVRWEESLRLLLAEGLDGFVELGPGRVLRGLLRTLAPAAASWNVEDPESLAATLSALAPAAGRNA
ncbi:MAG TPA: ACP S-malonyltransferase [Candidatus Eisenbacteria bacterium]|nr:ACP S-malonyltransferase [Candidatus Eisenbacteria bacterium]